MNPTYKIINDNYPVYAGTGILKEISLYENLFESYANIVILVDTNTVNYCLPWFFLIFPELKSSNIITIPNGEINKNIYTVIDIWKRFSDLYVNRNTLLINLGGGVVLDIGGFAASTYKRGIPFINIPTSLLAMADASVGGKTGIDLFNLKNLVGTFTQPKAVIVDTDFLATLSQEEINNGYAEIVKHALIADIILWKKIKRMPIDNQVNWGELIIRNIKLKHKIVKHDPFEKGPRKLLNFGHTVGHAIETYSLENGDRRLSHGESIVVGMICEIFLSVEKFKLDPFYTNEVCSYLLINFNHYKFPVKAIPQLIEIMKQDKKNIDGKIGFTLMKEIGEATINNYVDVKLIKKSLEYYLRYA